MNSTKKSILLQDLKKALLYNETDNMHLYIKLVDLQDKTKGLDSLLTENIRLAREMYEATDEAKRYIKLRLIEAQNRLKTL